MRILVIGIWLLSFGFMASATPWSIDNDTSTINFISIKKVDVAEIATAGPERSDRRIGAGTGIDRKPGR